MDGAPHRSETMCKISPTLMNNTPEPFLRNLWYLALPGEQLRRGQMRAKVLLGEPVVFGRTRDGAVFALRDICPHRAVPLSCGRFDGEEIECCYHGWRFDRAGHCTAIPSLVTGQTLDFERYGVRSYRTAEVQGNIWIYMADPDRANPTEPALTIPLIPGFTETHRAQFCQQIKFPGYVDHAVVGLMDPAHSPFVHRAWWWRTGYDFHEEAHEFVASPYGFTMVRHPINIMTPIYRLVGKNLETEIQFFLPGIRIETTTSDRYRVCNLTTVTPLTATESEVHFFGYWDVPWLGAIAPLMKPLAYQFLKQDRDVVEKQQIGLQYESTLKLIKDSDTPARWYYQLRREFAQSQVEQRPFQNPVKDQVLQWRG